MPVLVSSLYGRLLMYVVIAVCSFSPAHERREYAVENAPGQVCLHWHRVDHSQCTVTGPSCLPPLSMPLTDVPQDGHSPRPEAKLHVSFPAGAAGGGGTHTCVLVSVSPHLFFLCAPFPLPLVLPLSL